MTERIDIKPMFVVRLREGRASHIEPQLDQAWPAEKKLAWKLGCFIEDTGYTRVRLYFLSSNWCITAPGISSGGGIGNPRRDLNGIWDALNWISFGITAMQNGRPL